MEIPEGWVEIPMQELSTKPISYGVVQTGENLEDGIPCVRVVDMAHGELDPSRMIKTSVAISTSYKKTILEKGDILIALRGIIGRAALANSKIEGCNLTRGIARISPDLSKCCPKFLFQTINSPTFQYYIGSLANGSALQEISIKTLRNAKVPVPKNVEQQKRIAKLLGTWDRAIAATEALIAKSEAQKKALMQQLLTGKRRLPGFEGEWREVNLTDIAEVTTGSSNREDSKLVGEYVFFDRSTDIRRSARFLFDTEAVIVGGEGQEFVPKYFEGKFDLHQRAYAIHTSDQYSIRYLYYIIHYKRHLLRRFAVGSTVASLRMGTFTKIPVPIITLAEQKGIVAILDSNSLEIQALKAKLQTLKTEKAALMQQLLTGKRRVKLTEAAA